MVGVIMPELKPMDQQEALRIIQNVASHNPHDVPMPSQIVSAAATVVDRAAYERQLVRSAFDLICGAAEVTELIKKHVYHEHPLRMQALMETLRMIRLTCQRIENIVNECPLPNKVLGPGNEKREESVAKVKVAPQA